MAALVALSAAACSGGNRTNVEAVAPGVLASAVDGVSSGRIHLTVDSAGIHSTSELRFEGQDSSLSSIVERVGNDTAESHGPRKAAVRSITVDGTSYSDASLLLNLPHDRETSGGGGPSGPIGADWISQPAIDPPEGMSEPMLTDPLGSMVAVLRNLVIDRPGEPVEINGMAAIRNRIELSGGEASKLVADLGLYSGGDSLTDLAQRYPNTAERFEAVQDHIDANSEATVVVELDGSGQLMQAEVTARVDVDDYPDCALFGIDTAQVQMVLDGINQPQDIEAPPAEDVITWEEFARRRGFKVPSMPDAQVNEPPVTGTPGALSAPAVSDTTDLDAMPTTTFGGPGGGSMPEDLQAQVGRQEDAFLDEMLAGCPT